MKKESELKRLKIQIRGAENRVINRARQALSKEEGTIKELKEAVDKLDLLYDEAFDKFGLEY